MLSYLIGKVVNINKKTITLENSYCGYSIFVSNPKNYEINQICKVLIHKQITTTPRNNFQEELFGFKNYEEKELFLNLIMVSGVGAKTALIILKNDIQLIKQIIAQKSVHDFSNLTNLNHKISTAIVNEINQKINHKEIETNTFKVSELTETMINMGYRKDEINTALNNLNPVQKNQNLAEIIPLIIKHINENKINTN